MPLHFCTYDSSLLTSNISCPQRLYQSSCDPPSLGCLSPLPNFSTMPHTQPTFTQTSNLAYRLRAPQPFTQTSRNTRTPRVTLVPPPCHAHTPSCNVCAMLCHPCVSLCSLLKFCGLAAWISLQPPDLDVHDIHIHKPSTRVVATIG